MATASFSLSSHPFHPSLLNTLAHQTLSGGQIGACKNTALTSGYRALDRELPNSGWPPSVLIELLMSHPDIGELCFLAPTLSRLTQAGKTVVLMAPSHIPLTATLSELGLDMRHVLLIEADKPSDRMWAVEQALRSVRFGALLCWLPQARPDQLRRLQSAVAGTEGLAFMFRPLAAREQSSPSPLRIICQPAGENRMSVEIIKRRGPVHSAPIVLPLPVTDTVIKPVSCAAAKASVLSFPRHAGHRPLSVSTTPVPTALAA